MSIGFISIVDNINTLFKKGVTVFMKENYYEKHNYNKIKINKVNF